MGEGNGNPLQCSCLENLRDEGAWGAVISGVTQSRTQLKWLSSNPKKTNKKPTKICPHCHREMHWAKDCTSKLDLERKPIPGNSKQGTPQVPFNKNQGQILSFASNPQHPAMLPSIYQPQMIFSFTLKQSLLKYLPDFLDPCPHKPLVFYLASLVWLLKELLFTLE